MTQTHLVILGAGPAALGAAFRLSLRKQVKVTVLEANNQVGGNAGSFELQGVAVDYGSHRLHPVCDPEVMRDIRSLLGEELLDRRRHGRILLRGRWIHFPLQPIDLVFKLPPAFALGAAADVVRKMLRQNTPSRTQETFATVLKEGLGTTICRDFYFPYARKMWGVDPQELSAVQARRRVSANTPGRLARKILSAIPGVGRQGSGRFFYPRHGFGQIAQAYYRAAVENGVKFELGAHVQTVEFGSNGAFQVGYEREGQTLSVPATHVWSTIPITTLAASMRPVLPAEYLRDCDSIRYRAMVLIYLVLEQERFSEYDAYYFPQSDIPITRLSEPKNYADGQVPSHITVLCAELPCMPEDSVWGLSDEELSRLVCESLQRAGIPVRVPIRQVVTRRLRQAYPIYQHGYETCFNELDRRLSQVDGLLTFGRQGLFAHDNTHHALYMGYSAAACLSDSGVFDQEQWESFRRVFETHVVED